MNSNEKHEEIDCAELERLAAFGVLMIVKLTPALMLQRLQLLLAQFRPLFLQFLIFQLR